MSAGAHDGDLFRQVHAAACAASTRPRPTRPGPTPNGKEGKAEAGGRTSGLYGTKRRSEAVVTERLKPGGLDPKKEGRLN